MKAKAFSENAKAQVDVPTDPQKLQECANQQCSDSKLGYCYIIYQYKPTIIICMYSVYSNKIQTKK